MCAQHAVSYTQCTHATNRGLWPFRPLPTGVSTPVFVDRLSRCLAEFPDQDLANYILNGFTYGFDIGVQGTFTNNNTRPRNNLSARKFPAQVSEAVRKELDRGHTVGPFRSPPFQFTHCSPIGSAPKPDGTVRLVLDLSQPRGDAVNEHISKEEFACKYSSFDDAVDLVRALGSGVYMGKLDVKHAFRLCPVWPEQWPVLCYRWGGYFFVDVRLPFGSRSSPAIFNAFADVLQWVFVHIGLVAWMVHYLDDYFVTHHTRSECERDMWVVRAICQFLGVPLAPDKVVGPTQVLVYLGIEIDTVMGVARLPRDKLDRAQKLVAQWGGKRTATKRDLLELIGFLGFASKVVKPGRTFVRRLIDLSTTVSSLDHFVTINAEAREDIRWWQEFLPLWNGVEVFQEAPVTSDSIELHTDASDLGFGGVYGRRWVLGEWKEPWGGLPIFIREFFAIWVAVHTWGNEWADKQVVIHTDSAPAKDIWKKGTSRDKVVMKIVRTMLMFAARRNINILLKHVPGKHNNLADALSRFQVRRFRELLPEADVMPTEVDQQVWEM